MKNKIIFLIIISVFLINKTDKIYASGKIKGESVVSVFIGKYIQGNRISIYGYSSPESSIQIITSGISADTTADKSGYFAFKNVAVNKTIKDVCLISIDKNNLSTAPLCLPPIPNINNTNIGPVIMAPTIEVDKGNYLIGDNAILKGKSIPNKTIELSFFTQNDSVLAFNLVKPVLAYSIPKITAETDKNGDFTISIPTNSANKIKTFAQTAFDTNLSPKSIDLNINIYSVWGLIIKYIQIIIDSLTNHIIEILIFIELIYIYLQLKKKVHVNYLGKNKELMIINHELLKIDHEIIKK